MFESAYVRSPDGWPLMIWRQATEASDWNKRFFLIQNRDTAAANKLRWRISIDTDEFSRHRTLSQAAIVADYEDNNS